MIVPAVTPALAERSLIGASVHAFSVRAHTRSAPQDRRDLDFARRIAVPGELAESASLYAISLVWWAHTDRWSRRELLQAAVALMMQQVSADEAERRYEAGYRIFAHRLAEAALTPTVHASELELDGLVSGVAEIDRLTARFADSAVDAVLRSDQEAFGDPRSSAETMRDRMIALAYLPRAV